MVIKVVIGSNFGDEGKGLMADYFCHQSTKERKRCLNVLHNGGAQRGHTVSLKMEIGIKTHVFRHFGAGTFAGADTYFVENFLLNPMMFRDEYAKLDYSLNDRNIFVSPFCRVTTPYDIIINQIIEESRGNKRHGSCGIGIYETTIRDVANFKFMTFATLGKDGIRNILKVIRDEYLPERLNGYDISDDWKAIIESDGLIEHFISDLEFMMQKVSVADNTILEDYDTVVFEGGQGLLLDQNNKEYFPHLTPSNTGSKNPLGILNDISGIDGNDIEVCYVTRTYLTRHGAGRIDNECDKRDICPDMEDATNVPNEFQGSLRYAKMDVSKLKKRILDDFEPFRKIGAKLSLAVTHTNESELFVSNEKADYQEFFEGFNCVYSSDGKTRESVDTILKKVEL